MPIVQLSPIQFSSHSHMALPSASTLQFPPFAHFAIPFGSQIPKFRIVSELGLIYFSTCNNYNYNNKQFIHSSIISYTYCVHSVYHCILFYKCMCIHSHCCHFYKPRRLNMDYWENMGYHCQVQNLKCNVEKRSCTFLSNL